MEYIYLILLIISSISSGFDYFFVQVFNIGLGFLPLDKKILTYKYVLAASTKYFLGFRMLMIIIPLIIIIYILINHISLQIHWWIVLFVMMFYGLYFIGYLLPKIRRMTHWDLKNPISKWESLYNSYYTSCKILIYLSTLNLVIILISILIEILSLS